MCQGFNMGSHPEKLLVFLLQLSLQLPQALLHIAMALLCLHTEKMSPGHFKMFNGYLFIPTHKYLFPGGWVKI